MIFDGLEALYAQVRKMQISADGSPRFKPALIVTAAFYPVVSAGLVLLFGVPPRPEYANDLPSYFALPSLFLAAFLVSAVLATYIFDRRRDAIDRKFAAMPTIASVEGMLLLTAAFVVVVTAEAWFVTSVPLISFLAFATFLLAGWKIAGSGSTLKFSL